MIFMMTIICGIFNIFYYNKKTLNIFFIKKIFIDCTTLKK